MTVTPPRTEGSVPAIEPRADTPETLQAAGLEFIGWLESEQARLEREITERMTAIQVRFADSPVSEDLQKAILRDLTRRLSAMA